MSLNPRYGKRLRVTGTSSKQDLTSFTSTSPTACFPPFQRQQLGKEKFISVELNVWFQEALLYSTWGKFILIYSLLYHLVRLEENQELGSVVQEPIKMPKMPETGEERNIRLYVFCVYVKLK